jgi:hypothetical protein
VLRLLTVGSIDEAVMRKADEKRRFADSSITGQSKTMPSLHLHEVQFQLSCVFEHTLCCPDIMQVITRCGLISCCRWVL